MYIVPVTIIHRDLKLNSIYVFDIYKPRNLSICYISFSVFCLAQKMVRGGTLIE